MHISRACAVPFLSLQVRLPPQPKDDDVNELFVPKLNDLVEARQRSEEKSSGESLHPRHPRPTLNGPGTNASNILKASLHAVRCHSHGPRSLLFGVFAGQRTQ